MPRHADFRAVGEFAASRHGVFNMSQAAERDVSRNDVGALVRQGLVVPIRPGVWRFANHPTSARQAAYAATLGVRAVASFFTAGSLQCVDGLTDPPETPELLCHHGAPVRMAGVLVRRTRHLPKVDVTEVDHIPCTTLARTICDLAGLITTPQLVRAIDDVQRRGVSMQWVLQRALRLSRSGRPGSSEVVDVVRRRMNGYRVPESYFERLLSIALTSPTLTGIERQHTLRDARGSFVARFDLAVPWARLGIEGHSRRFHVGEAIEQYDEDRDIRAAQQGWEIAYLGFAATRSPAAACRDIELIVQRRMQDLGLHPARSVAQLTLRV